jgi:hypothetical protein
MNCTCCKGCTKRTLGCHSDCKDYNEFVNNNLKQKEQIRKERINYKQSIETSFDGYKRMKHRRCSNSTFKKH